MTEPHWREPSRTIQTIASPQKPADLVYHMVVALTSRGVPWRDVLNVLTARAGTSGIEEKAQRTKANESS